MNYFSNVVKNVFTKNDGLNNNILETSHHNNQIFEKIDATKYFRFTVSAIFHTNFLILHKIVST